jgi:hypothetical protein
MKALRFLILSNCCRLRANSWLMQVWLASISPLTCAHAHTSKQSCNGHMSVDSSWSVAEHCTLWHTAVITQWLCVCYTAVHTERAELQIHCGDDLIEQHDITNKTNRYLVSSLNIGALSTESYLYRGRAPRYEAHQLALPALTDHTKQSVTTICERLTHMTLKRQRGTSVL